MTYRWRVRAVEAATSACIRVGRLHRIQTNGEVRISNKMVQNMKKQTHELVEEVQHV